MAIFFKNICIQRLSLLSSQDSSDKHPSADFSYNVKRTPYVASFCPWNLVYIIVQMLYHFEWCDSCDYHKLLYTALMCLQCAASYILAYSTSWTGGICHSLQLSCLSLPFCSTSDISSSNMLMNSPVFVGAVSWSSCPTVLDEWPYFTLFLIHIDFTVASVFMHDS